jgi:hypothetical protein
MTSNPTPTLANSDPRILSIIVIGTPENVATYIRDQHLRGYAKTYEWSQPQPALDRPGKVATVLHRIML